MNSAFRLMPSHNYVTTLTKHIQSAQQRIYILSLAIIDEELTHELFNAVRAAAARGLEVYVTGDYFTVTEHGGLTTLRAIKRRAMAARKLRHSFEKAGAHFTWLSRDSLTLYSGRTHTKWTVVDDTVYAFGGTNLYKEGIESVDFMFKVENAHLADQLAHEQIRIIKASRNKHAYRSHSFTIPEGRVLIDGGFVGDSLIYRRACDLVGRAKHAVYVSQYAPNGRLGRRLKQIGADLYFNPWHNPSDANSKLFIRVSSFLSGHSTRYTRAEYLHCKFIICTMPDGEKVAITGSHNFANGGMWLGTREIALETSEPKIIRQLEAFLKKSIR